STGQNLLEAAAVLLRGLLANAIVVLVFLLAAALLTKAAYPAWGDLPTGDFLPKLVVVLLGFVDYVAGLVLPPSAANWINSLYSLISTGIAELTSWLSSLIGGRTAAKPFLTTLAVTAILAVTLIIWALARSAKDTAFDDVDSGYLKVASALLAVTAI